MNSLLRYFLQSIDAQESFTWPSLTAAKMCKRQHALQQANEQQGDGSSMRGSMQMGQVCMRYSGKGLCLSGMMDDSLSSSLKSLSLLLLLHD